MDNLNIKLEEPLTSNVGMNQRFIVSFPGNIVTHQLEKHNVLINYDDGTIVWCNLAFDDECPNKLFIYPSVLMNAGNSITLYICDVTLDVDGVEVLSETKYFHFDVGDYILSYPDDEFSCDYESEDVVVDDLEIILTKPANGVPFVSGDTTIEIVFNKDLASSSVIKDYIEVKKTHVLL